MPTFSELESAALAAYDRGDVEGAIRLKEEALARQEHKLNVINREYKRRS